MKSKFTDNEVERILNLVERIPLTSWEEVISNYHRFPYKRSFVTVTSQKVKIIIHYGFYAGHTHGMPSEWSEAHKYYGVEVDDFIVIDLDSRDNSRYTTQLARIIEPVIRLTYERNEAERRKKRVMEEQAKNAVLPKLF